MTKSVTKKLTVRFSKRLKAEMLGALFKSKYNLRGKSKWLGEAIEIFLLQPNFVELSEQGISMNQAELTEVEAFYISTDLIKKMKNASIEIRVQYPLFEGVQSALIRSAVIYRLMLGK